MRRHTLSAIFAVCTLLATASAWAQNPDYHLTIGSTAGVSGTVSVPVTFQNDGELVAGWSYGICHDGGVDIVSVELGADAATIQAGDPPDFESAVIYPGEGWTEGLVIDFFQVELLGVGSYETNVATYSLNCPPGSVENVYFCDTLGAIPAATVVTIEGGVSVDPETSDGTITCLDQTFHYVIDDQDLPLSTSSFYVYPTIEEDSGNDGYPNDVLAFSMSVTHGSLVDADSVVDYGPLTSLNGGAGPDFFGSSIYSDGVTAGVIFAYEMDEPLTFASPQPVICVQYSVNGSPSEGQTANLSFQSQGDPEVANTVIVGLDEIQAQGDNGTITFTASAGAAQFVRGDCNADGAVDIADPVYNLAYLFQDGPSQCNDAQDVNDDGAVDVADPVYNLSFQFSMGPAIPAPSVCGTDPTPDATGCDSFPPCAP